MGSDPQRVQGQIFRLSQPHMWQGYHAGRSLPVLSSSSRTGGEVQFTNITQINSMSHPHRKLPMRLLKIHPRLANMWENLPLHFRCPRVYFCQAKFSSEIDSVSDGTTPLCIYFLASMQVIDSTGKKKKQDHWSSVKTQGLKGLYRMPQTCSELFWARFESYLPRAKGQTALNSRFALNMAK